MAQILSRQVNSILNLNLRFSCLRRPCLGNSQLRWDETWVIIKSTPFIVHRRLLLTEIRTSVVIKLLLITRIIVSSNLMIVRLLYFTLIRVERRWSWSLLMRVTSEGFKIIMCSVWLWNFRIVVENRLRGRLHTKLLTILIFGSLVGKWYGVVFIFIKVRLLRDSLLMRDGWLWV